MGLRRNGGALLRPHRFELYVFGSVRLHRDGQLLPMPPGNGMKTLALLTLSGGSMHRDSLCERLWPDARMATARNSLRSVLTRLRATTGIDIQRQGDLVLVGEPIWCDVDEFIRIATRAAADLDPVPERNRLVLQAQELWSGPPLEAWRYEPWAAQVREIAFRLQGRLWNFLDDPPPPRP